MMNKQFLLLDKINNLQKIANCIVKFNFDGKDYLIYYVDENDNNCQIFVSKLIVNSDGKYFVDNLVLEEKKRLNDIVYNIVILTPTEGQKGVSFDVLKNNLSNKFGVSLSYDIPELGNQEYFSNCSVAITSRILVDAAIKLYSDNLSVVTIDVPTWTAPTEISIPTPSNEIVNDSNLSTISNEEVVIVPNNEPTNGNNDVVEPIIPVSNTLDSTVLVPNTVNESLVVSSVSETVDSTINPQLEKIAIMSDPSVSAGLNIQGQPNLGKLKKAGFAHNKNIIIGTVCLVLAIVVVVAAFILISNLK